MLGLYLDALSDEQRDRVIEAEDFGYGRMWDSEGRGCLVAVAEIGKENGFIHIAGQFCRDEPPYGVGDRFDNLIKKFGKARVIRACKTRAAKANHISLERATRSEIFETLRIQASIP